MGESLFSPSDQRPPPRTTLTTRPNRNHHATSPDETHPRECDLFTQPSYSTNPSSWSTSTTHSLPLLGELYFHARGGYVNGNVDVSVGKFPRMEGGQRDEVLVKVQARYGRRERVVEWHVCRTGDDKVAGVVLVVGHRSCAIL